MYLRESQPERSRPPLVEWRVCSGAAKTGIRPVPAQADAGYANSLGVEYFSLMVDLNRQVPDSPEATALKKG